MATEWDLKQQASEKEQELQMLREQHTKLLEETVRGVQNELLVERQRLQQLQGDFEYNLGLLEQRDQELSHYDSTFAEVKSAVSTLTAENSELKVMVDELRGEVARQKEAQQQLKSYYLNRINENHAQTEAYRQAKEQELDSEHCKLEALQSELQRKLLEVEGELQVQQERMTAELDEALKRRDREHQARVSELSTTVLSREAQLRQLGRELQLAKAAQEGSEGDASSKAGEVAQLEKQLRERQWEAEDAINARDTRIVELEGQLAHAWSSMKTLQSDFERRHAELDRLVKEKESSLQASKEGHREREAVLERRACELQGQLEQQEADMRRREWSHSDALQEKEKEIESYRQQLAEHARRCEEREGEMVRVGVAKDLRLQSLQDSTDKLQADLRRKDEDVEHYRRELSLALEREKSVEQSKAQLELDWQQRVGDVERQQSLKHQELIRQLSRAREEALVQCRELQQTVSQQSRVVQAVQEERDIAIATLSKHELVDEYQSGCQQGGVGRDHVTELRDHVIQQLRQQNKELHAVIHEMRREMEQLTEVPELRDEKDEASPQVAPNEGRLTMGYVKYMESEVVRLKSMNHQLKERVQELSLTKKPPTPPPLGSKRSPSPPPMDDKPSKRESQHRAHLVALSDTIATLQREKLALELEALQLNTRVQQLEKSLMAYQEKAHLLRAGQVPKSKVHQKLLQATQVIITLVREKEALVQEGRWLREEVGRMRRLQDVGEGRRVEGIKRADNLIQSLSEDDAAGKQNAPRNQSKSQTLNRSLEEAPHLDVLEQQAYQHTQKHPLGSGRHSALSPARKDERRDSTNGVQTHRSTQEGGVHHSNPPEETLDISLHSLKFTESSDLEDSAQQMFQMMDPLSSTLQSEHWDVTGQPTHTADQAPPPPPPAQPQFLELRGSRLTAHRRGAGGARRQQTRKAGPHKLKPKIRNYNKKED